jgi:hypothetical protein
MALRATVITSVTFAATSFAEAFGSMFFKALIMAALYFG